MELRLEGAGVFLADYGKGVDPARPTVLFVHGAGMDHSVWPLQARHFAYRGSNALAVDLPGHGRSAGELLGSIAAMADWLGALIEALRVTGVHLVGHSMGALIGLELAARQRKRIARLALLGAAPKMPVHPALLAAAARPEPLAPALICDWGFGPAGHFGGHKAPGSWMLGHALRLLAQSAGPRLHADLTACHDYRDGPQAAAGVRCPTLVIAGAADRMTPVRHAASLAETIKGAQLVVLPACGHMMMVEQPDAALDALLAFLAP
ncbi:MAG TPA: alpha/beta hydrolase [Geminicoccaceae bacterium]|jgi:pimeloyl-ACP methyl ester carboxylesterase|nr:alpha/beta hydrolase [Geminicoccaceae bacterium]